MEASSWTRHDENQRGSVHQRWAVVWMVWMVRMVRWRRELSWTGMGGQMGWKQLAEMAQERRNPGKASESPWTWPR